MTHNPVTVLADGTRVYVSGHRYRPVPDAERVRKRNKPDHPDAVLFASRWYVPLDLLPDEQRVLPDTRADEDAYLHAVEKGNTRCRCKVCQRPEAERFKRRWRREQGYRYLD